MMVLGLRDVIFFFFARPIALLLNDCSYLHLIESSLVFRKILRWMRMPSSLRELVQSESSVAWIPSIQITNMVGLT